MDGIPYPDPRLTWVDEDSWAKTGPRILTDMIAYLLTAVISLSIFTLSLFAWRLYTGQRKLTIQMFGLSMLFYGLGALSTAIGHAFFLMNKISYDPSSIVGLIFPWSIPLSMMLAAISPYFTIEFGYLIAEREHPPKSIKTIIILMILALFVIMISPYNWYAMYPPTKDSPNIRPLSNLLLLIINLFAIIQLVLLMAKRIRKENDPIRKSRLKTIISGFIFLLLFFFGYVAYEVLLIRNIVLYFLVFSLSLIGMGLIYLGVVAPELYIRILEKHLEKNE